MAQSLVIVESPAKAKTISKFLGKNYKVKASMGHVRDLPKSQLGVEIDNDYKPKYITIRGKGDLINELKKEAKKSNKVYIATDPDREGEAISWHIANILGINLSDKCRIEFHEITKNAVTNAIKNPRTINKNLVDAQQARRVLDRLVGYEISPVLWRKIKWGLSAGRVQSVAVRLICDRENEIKSFVPEEYWSITAYLKNNNKEIEAKLISKGKEKIKINSEHLAKEIVKTLKNKKFTVEDVKKQEKKKNPPPPFITSSLQQEAYRKLNFSTKKTMSIAQQLYEGIDLKKEGTVGLITYMRTDSVRISDEAKKMARDFIAKTYGKSYLPNYERQFKTKGAAQDAHEAIRPTYVEKTPESIKDSLTNDQFKLYKLIWDRFIASQMADAIYDTVTIDFSAEDFIFRANGSILKFSGFLAVYKTGEEEEDKLLPEVEKGEIFDAKKIDPKQHFTQPPSRFTEATLVKALEEYGIGRPSTYAPIITTILDRGYVEREKKNLKPTELGEIVTELMKEYFSNIVDVDFTAEMESKLDKIEEGDENWVKVIDEFYRPLKEKIAVAEEKIGKITIEEPVEETDIICEKCGRNMVIKKGRFGKFLACPGYPECKNTKPLVDELDVPCPICGGKIVVRKGKSGKTFYGCGNYPECNFASWDKPTNKKCPKCGKMLFEKSIKGKTNLVCHDKNCGYKE
ncbi:DNA topoisomerase 1 [Caloramator mitchellensis]|uniref:DNA topoisomerase 1 n=1 Tax=Caloramator mitchellensis TaxID=908809 RepID=A0A0R3JV62_CALMK|nr:type I DNA topoisomerase [Caloramator mitchellensis]KRQ86970.1 DNA topoisomerase 1 [Caloramator mitchellensis]